MEPLCSIVSTAVFVRGFAGTRTAVGAVFIAAATVGQELIHDIDIFIVICVLPPLGHNWSPEGLLFRFANGCEGGYEERIQREYEGKGRG